MDINELRTLNRVGRITYFRAKEGQRDESDRARARGREIERAHKFVLRIGQCERICEY